MVKNGKKKKMVETYSTCTGNIRFDIWYMHMYAQISTYFTSKTLV